MYLLNVVTLVLFYILLWNRSVIEIFMTYGYNNALLLTHTVDLFIFLRY